LQERSAPAFGALAEALGDPVLVAGAGGGAARTRTVAGSSGAPASLGVANGVVAVREGPQPYRPAVTDGPDVGEAVVHLGAARLPAASLAHRCHDVSGDILDLEQLDGEIVEGVVALVQPLEQGLGAAICLDGVPTTMSGALSALMAPRSRALIAAYTRAVNSLPSGTAPKLSTLSRPLPEGNTLAARPDRASDQPADSPGEHTATQRIAHRPD
jgi:hypothetical protein